ncbi:hypothetical protein AB0E83_26120 [Streptomyces sp. NPDC035033]|uniref:hypothetical protein n=1 Tax=Streptomyces sp. NPDC035033 TaxID=3155368 RepID=UPI0033CDB9A1
MKKPPGKLAAVAGAAAAAVALTAAPAPAAPSTVWTVTPSPVGIAAQNTTNVVLLIEIVKDNGIGIVCSRSSFSGSLQSATGNPATIGTIGAIAFGATGAPCTSVLGNVTFTSATPWSVVAQDHTVSTGVTQGHFGNVDLKGTVGACVFRVRGNLPVTYANATGKLAVASATGDLTVVSQTNCGGAAPVGASLVVKADHLVKKADTTVVPTIVGTNP